MMPTVRCQILVVAISRIKSRIFVLEWHRTASPSHVHSLLFLFLVMSARKFNEDTSATHDQPNLKSEHRRGSFILNFLFPGI